jgi:hypothetical protein
MVALSIGMQQGKLKGNQNKLRVGAAVAAIWTRRDTPRRLVFKSKPFSVMGRVTFLLLELISHGLYARCRRWPPLEPHSPIISSSPPLSKSFFGVNQAQAKLSSVSSHG